MTDYELNFSVKIEEMLSIVDEPVFRQIIVEVKCFYLGLFFIRRILLKFIYF